MVAFAVDYANRSNIEKTSTAELEDILRRVAEAGFTHIHWCHEWDGDYTYSYYEMLQIRQWMDKYGLRAKGLHATEGNDRPPVEGRYKYRCESYNRRDFTSENELNRLAGVELIRNRVDMAHVLGATEIVLHMQLPYKSFEEEPGFRDRYYRQVCKSFDELQEECKAKGVRICIENLLGAPLEHQKYQFDYLFSRYDADFMGFCFDTGHSYVISNHGDMLELAKRYKDRMYAIHMSDNLGMTSDECWADDIKMTKCDLHLLPFEGTFDWDGFAKVVAESVYELPVLLEVGRGKDEPDAEFLHRALEAGKKFTKMVESYKQAQ